MGEVVFENKACEDFVVSSSFALSGDVFDYCFVSEVVFLVFSDVLEENVEDACDSFFFGLFDNHLVGDDRGWWGNRLLGLLFVVDDL